MRYSYPGWAIPVEHNLTSTDPKYMPDADPDLQVSTGEGGQAAANGDNTPPMGGMNLHERGSNASPARSAPTIFDK